MSNTNIPLPEISAEVGFGDEDAEMARYRAEGIRRALDMDNRGPIRLDAEGKLEAGILEAYWREGFYVFEGVIDAAERADIERDVARLLDNAPIAKDAEVDRHGRPALGVGLEGRNVRMTRPLSDPLGGTGVNHGRHPLKMLEPETPDGAPDWVMQLLLGTLQHSEACLRLYGHPRLLAVAEAVNGPDFTPFNEGLWIKQPRLGSAVAWHQDGWTHWDSPDLDAGTHGFNFMMMLYGCDAANGLWVVPGSHDRGKLDVSTLVGPDGSDRLPGAVPLVCAPGDVAIVNRQAVHGSFANVSDNVRVSVHFGFHRRRSVLGVRSGGIHNPVSLYDEAYIRERARLIMYAIDARRQRFPEEASYVYQPLAEHAADFRFSSEVMASLRDYNLQDIGI